MIDLPSVNLLTIIFNDHPPALKAVLPVVRYMQSIVRFGRITLFSATAVPTPHPPGVEVIQIHPTDYVGLSIYLNYLVRLFVRLPHMMYFQDDGFILDPSQWDPKFLEYDYIGAPWEDGVVGNEGFSIQSQRFLWAKSHFMWDGVDGQDWFYCRTMREEMLKLGVRYAPTEVAARFSAELCNHGDPTFGYHGWRYCPPKHAQGLKLIEPFK